MSQSHACPCHIPPCLLTAGLLLLPAPWDTAAWNISSAESPGYCPRAGSAIGPHCGMRCHNDTACRSGEKCCPRGCCTRCVLAEPGEVSWGSPPRAEDGVHSPHYAVGEPWAGPAKRGFCPRKRAHRSAAACPNRCTDDRDCPGEHKCCFSGCGLACTPPDTGLFPWPQVGSACPHCGVWPPTACWSSLEGI
uniref:WAP domain-containing protein n=1 Tax=Malurus cyaneus samueli TaxID=2593467 RepID=A0A8C5X4K0_9PASS